MARYFGVKCRDCDTPIALAVYKADEEIDQRTLFRQALFPAPSAAPDACTARRILCSLMDRMDCGYFVRLEHRGTVLTLEEKAGFGILEAAQLDSSNLTEYLGSGRVAKLFDAKGQVFSRRV
jgi:hypothetical protein